MDAELYDSYNNTPNSSFVEQEGTLNKNISSILSMLESPLVVDNAIQDTQSLQILKDVIAYVEVRTGTENRSKAICRELQHMGATIVPKFNNDVTHVVFKDGKKSTRDKALKKGIHLISVLWVDSCKQNQEVVSESLFPAGKPEDKGTPIMVARLKKSKSMQPKDFDEDVASSAERNVKNRKRLATKAERAARYKVLDTPGDDNTPTRRPMFLVENTCPRSPNDSYTVCHSITIPATPPSMREKLDHIRARKSFGTTDIVENSESDEEPIKETPHISPTSAGIPLQRRLFGGKEICSSEDPLASNNSSPLFLSGGSSNNSTSATSPYVQKLLKQKKGCDSITGGPEAGFPCDKSSSMPPKRKSRQSLVSEIETPSLKGNITSELVESTVNDNLRPKKNEAFGDKKDDTTKSHGRKKKLLSTSQEMNPSSQLIDPLKMNDKNSAAGHDEKEVSDKTTRRRKVTAKKKGKNGADSRDPSVLFKGNGDIGKFPGNKGKKTTKRKITGQDVSGTPKKKQKAHHRTNDNNLGEEADNETESCFETEPVKSNRSSTKIAKSNKNKIIEKEISVAGRRKSILKICKLDSTESPYSQPLALDIDTPPAVKKRSSLKRDDEQQSSSGILNNGISNGRSTKYTSRRKSVNFKTTPSSTKKSEAPISQKNLRGRRKSVGTTLDSVPKAKPTTTRRKSIATPQVTRLLRSTEKEDNSINEVSETNKRGKSALGCTNLCKSDPTQKEQNISQNSRHKSTNNETSLTTSEDLKTIHDDQISPEIAIQSKRRKTSINSVFSRRRSVRFSKVVNHDDTVTSTIGSSSINYEDSMTDVTALSTQNLSLTPSIRTKKIIPALAKQKQSSKENASNKSEISDIDIETNYVLNNFDNNIEKGRSVSLADMDNISFSHCELLEQDKAVESPRLTDTSSTLFNLTNSRKSIEEFHSGPIIKKKSRSCSLPLPNQTANSSNVAVKANKVARNRSLANNKSKKSSLTVECKTKSTTAKNDKKKWKEMNISAVDDKKPRKVLVMTSLHFDEQDMVKSVVERLDGYDIQENVNKNTTHVICGSGERRTLNVLTCIAQGCWLLSLEWVFKSLEAGQWLEESDYEMCDSFPSCKTSRCKKDKERGSYCTNLFVNHGSFYVVESSKPPKKDLIRLLKLCGGKITSVVRLADIVVGSLVRPEKTCVSEQWVLDCITQMNELPLSAYKLNSAPSFEREPSPDY